MGLPLECPECGANVEKYRNPIPTADLILLDEERGGLFLVERANEPRGWVLPGGFVECGEDPAGAAAREGDRAALCRRIFSP